MELCTSSWWTFVPVKQLHYIGRVHVCLQYKKVDRWDCKNYKGICVVSSIGQLYERIINKLLEKKIQELEEQSGFRVSCSYIDNICVLKIDIDKQIVNNKAVHLAFIDLQKVYDSVTLSKLWNTMVKQGMSRLLKGFPIVIFWSCQLCEGAIKNIS